MKYAILGPRGAINRITDTEPLHTGPQATVVEITDEQAATVQAGRESTPRVRYFLVDGELKTLREKIEIDRLASKSPEERAAEQMKQAAWDASAAAFEALPLGKQALWEQVRVKVADFILQGDFEAAATTIATVPPLYEGMEDDRATFLALFNQGE